MLWNFISCEKNTTCDDGRFCFTYLKVEDHCEILTGNECHPPCDIKLCEILVENNVDCEHYLCAPAPPSVATKTFFVGFAGSITSTIILFLTFKGVKKILSLRRRVNQNEEADITGRENQNEEANITGRENEGDGTTRPIYNPGRAAGGQASTPQAAACQPSTSRQSTSLPSTPTKERKKEVPCCEKDVCLKKDPFSKRLRSSVKRVSWKADDSKGKKLKVFYF